MAAPTQFFHRSSVILDPPPGDGDDFEPTIVIVLLTGPLGFSNAQIITDGAPPPPLKKFCVFLNVHNWSNIVPLQFACPLHVHYIYQNCAICVHYSKRYCHHTYRAAKRHQRVFRTAFLAVRTSVLFTTAL